MRFFEAAPLPTSAVTCSHGQLTKIWISGFTLSPSKKSVDQQGGKRVTATYHVSPSLFVPDPGPYMWDYTEKTPTNLHGHSHTHTDTALKIYKTKQKNLALMFDIFV